ncbi:MAG: hypothetical protein E7028_03945 [Planctomycetaceae bacterium]|nr:hypothetical protein [Planctomycetaceae bacterium]
MNRIDAALNEWIRAEKAYQAAQDLANKRKGERDAALKKLRLAKEQDDSGQAEIPFEKEKINDVP